MAPTAKAPNVLPTPYPYTVTGSTHVVVNGVAYDTSNGGGSKIPVADLEVMAKYDRSIETAYAAAGKPDGGPLGTAYVNLAHKTIADVVDKGSTNLDNLADCAAMYTLSVKQVTSAGAIPGADTTAAVVGGAVSGVTDVADFLQALSNPTLWLRVGEFALGGVMIAIGLIVVLRSQGIKTPKSPLSSVAGSLAKPKVAAIPDIPPVM